MQFFWDSGYIETFSCFRALECKNASGEALLWPPGPPLNLCLQMKECEWTANTLCSGTLAQFLRLWLWVQSSHMYRTTNLEGKVRKSFSCILIWLGIRDPYRLTTCLSHTKFMPWSFSFFLFVCLGVFEVRVTDTSSFNWVFSMSVQSSLGSLWSALFRSAYMEFETKDL